MRMGILGDKDRREMCRAEDGRPGVKGRGWR